MRNNLFMNEELSISESCYNDIRLLVESYINERNENNKQRKNKWENKLNKVSPQTKKKIENKAQIISKEANDEKKMADEADKIYSSKPANYGYTAKIYDDKYRHHFNNYAELKGRLNDLTNELGNRFKNREHKYQGTERTFYTNKQ